MTDRQEPSETEQPLTDKQPSARHGVVDWFLQALVMLANNNTFEVGITLNVGGLIVSGVLVGGSKYFDGIAEEWRIGHIQSGGKSDDADSWKGIISEFGEIYRENIRKREQAAREGARPDLDQGILHPEYIHLKNARMYHPGQAPIPTNGGIWWRGRLRAVDGFILGEFS